MAVVFVFIFVGISLFSAFGGRSCATMEHEITGKVQFENPFKRRRMISLIVSELFATAVATAIAMKMNVLSAKGFNWGILILAILIGSAICLFIHLKSYKMFLLKHKK
jgi:hypothetical protein